MDSLKKNKVKFLTIPIKKTPINIYIKNIFYVYYLGVFYGSFMGIIWVL